MGHVRTGPLPATRRWQQVVRLIAGGACASQMATATAAAAERGLRAVADDAGVVVTVWLLVRLPLAARTDQFGLRLRGCGVDVPDDPGLFDILAGVSDAVDAALKNNRGRTDLGELAQTAGVEALAAVGERANTLFGASPAEVRAAFAAVGTPARFGAFARRFFSRFAFKCLNYFLSKATPDQTAADGRFPTVAAMSAFADALSTHCFEASAIVERFSEEWFSKRNHLTEGQIGRDETAGFVAHCMTKLTAELRKRTDADGR